MQLPNTLNKPYFLQKIQWAIDPVGYMESAAQQYKDFFSTGIFGVKNSPVFVYHPQALQEILTNDRKKLTAPGDANKLVEPFVGNNSVILLDGDRHRKRRQLVMPSFHGERMRVYGELISNLTEQVLSALPKNQPFLARSVTQDISLQVILKVVFGLYEGKRYEEIKQRLMRMGDIFNSPLISSLVFFPFLQKDFGAWSPWGIFMRRRAAIDELIYAEIAERREKQNLEGVDILSLLMSAKDEDGNSMTDRELRDELMTLLQAGNETTASAMAWGLYWTHQKPEVREKLLQELDTLGENPDPMSIFKLPYLTAVCNETLRTYPVAMLTFDRVVQEPFSLMGHPLEVGTKITGCIYLLHQREDLYPQPKEFRPERFLERQFSPYEFMPFGSGARRCLGEALAVFEMKIVLAKILSSYQMTLADTKAEFPQRRGVTLTPANGVKMMITCQRARQKLPVAV